MCLVHWPVYKKIEKTHINKRGALVITLDVKANVDVDLKVGLPAYRHHHHHHHHLKRTQKKFRFAEKNNCPFYFVSAADGTNVVKVFSEIIKLGNHYKNNTDNFMDAVMELLAEQRLDD